MKLNEIIIPSVCDVISFIVLVILIYLSIFLIAWRVNNFVFQNPPPNLTIIKYPGFLVFKNWDPY